MPDNEENKYALTSWGQPTQEDLVCPSGQVCRVRKLEIEDILMMDVMDEIDTLTSLVSTEHVQPAMGKKKAADRPQKKLTKKQEADANKAAVKKLTEDPKAFATLTWMLDSVTAMAVVAPAIYKSLEGTKGEYTRIPDDKRKTDRTYADSVGFADKMKIFEVALGNLGEMETFRTKQESALGSVEAEPEDAMPTE